MNNKAFDGFEVKIRPSHNNEWEAYNCELPEFSASSPSPIQAVAKLFTSWIQEKNNCAISNRESPIPLSKQNFSGQFNTRIDPMLHKALVIEASKRGISLNTLVSKKLKESTKGPDQENEAKLIDIERSAQRSTVTILFENAQHQKLGLEFIRSNLGDELSDSTANSNEKLHNAFSSAPLRDVIQSFLAHHSFSSANIPVIRCLIVSHQKSLCPLLHYKNPNNFFPKDYENFAKDFSLFAIEPS